MEQRKKHGIGMAKRFAMPFAVVLGVMCMMMVIFYPMMHLEVKGLPVAIVSLDEGVETPQASVNVGETMAEQLTSNNDDSATMVWTRLDDEAELDEAIENNEYYAAVVIPEDFSAQQVQAQLNPDDESATPTLRVIIDNGKSPVAASLLAQALPSVLEQTGANVETETVHEGDTASSSSSGLAIGTMMAQNMAIAPLFVMSFVGAMFVSRTMSISYTDSRLERTKRIGVQLALAVVVSLAASLAVDCISAVVSGNWMPAAAIPFMWMASLCVMLAALALFDIATPLGAACGALTLALGLSSGMFPYEMLPEFWQDWIYPWVPQHFIGDGVRDIVYNSHGAWNSGSAPLLVVGAVGLALLLVVVALPSRKPRQSAFER
ncbi:YhgE/Pip domain-containing protein [Bifidobacterium eulemuris]|uniref:ABC transporter permease n=1 Tax=Bifidobacterium eulemuris TaxID=1765219 RepID=A0A261GCT8_9BIFI|nr:ABC transporter permease [Bifidobacterium eulemuris]OZG69261.1 ABC-2 family transporter protein [Bifidobacterium eulemuris]QOL31233.1 ABC transporter permease [Bifidobacterium eulemuris]